MLEFLANVDVEDFDPFHPPELAYVAADIPDGAALTVDAIGMALPTNWNDIPAPAVDAAIGDEWIGEARSLALIVPSVHIPLATPERNVLLNPRHPHFTNIHYTVDELTYDRRLLATRRAREEGGRR